MTKMMANVLVIMVMEETNARIVLMVTTKFEAHVHLVIVIKLEEKATHVMRVENALIVTLGIRETNA